MRPDVLSNDALDVRNFILVNFMFVKLCLFHNESTLSFQSSSNISSMIAIANENNVFRECIIYDAKDAGNWDDEYDVLQ